MKLRRNTEGFLTYQLATASTPKITPIWKPTSPTRNAAPLKITWATSHHVYWPQTTVRVCSYSADIRRGSRPRRISSTKFATSCLVGAAQRINTGLAQATFVYDADGDRGGMADGTGATSYGYDELDHLVSAASLNGTVGYRHISMAGPPQTPSLFKTCSRARYASSSFRLRTNSRKPTGGYGHQSPPG